MPFKKPFIVGEGKKMKRLLPSLPRNIKTQVARRSPPLSENLFFEDFFIIFRFCFWDLLKTNLKEKVIIFKSLQEFFPARNWLWFLSHRKKWRKLIEFYFQWDCALFRFYSEIKWISLYCYLWKCFSGCWSPSAGVWSGKIIFCLLIQLLFHFVC